jgi:hypothetical protein
MKYTFEAPAALRHPDVDLPAIRETFARSLGGLLASDVVPSGCCPGCGDGCPGDGNGECPHCMHVFPFDQFAVHGRTSQT